MSPRLPVPRSRSRFIVYRVPSWLDVPRLGTLQTVTALGDDGPHLHLRRCTPQWVLVQQGDGRTRCRTRTRTRTRTRSSVITQSQKQKQYTVMGGGGLGSQSITTRSSRSDPFLPTHVHAQLRLATRHRFVAVAAQRRAFSFRNMLSKTSRVRLVVLDLGTASTALPGTHPPLDLPLLHVSPGSQ